MRTTIDVDPVILGELKERGRAEGKTLGQLVSELLAPVLKQTERAQPPEFVWHTTEGRFLVDIEDKDAVYDILDRDQFADE